MRVLILEKKWAFWRGQYKWGTWTLCTSVCVRGKLLDFLGVVAAEHEAERQTEMGEVGPLYAAVSQAHEVKAKVVGGQLTVSGLVGYALVMLKDEPSLRWWVMGRPWLSSRAGWPWSALGVCFRQHLSCCVELKGPLRGFAALHLLARGLVFWMEKGWTGEDHKAQSGLFWWWLSDCCLHYWYINSLLFFCTISCNLQHLSDTSYVYLNKRLYSAPLTACFKSLFSYLSHY